MKTILFLLAMLPLSVFAQSKADYETSVSQFMEYYNRNEPEKICDMYSDEWGEAKSKLWNTTQIENLHKEYGKMQSFEYLGIDKNDPEEVRVFKTVFDKSTHAMSLTLDKNKKTGTFRFHTESGEIKKMMGK